MDVTLKAAVPADIDWLAELRAVALRADLERLGRFTEEGVRARMRASFRPEWTRVIVQGREDIGSITARLDGSVRWIEHFYLVPDRQSQGIGTRVLTTVLAEPWEGTTRLNVLQGSPALRLYERSGFEIDTEDRIDIFMTLRRQNTAA